MRSGVLVMIILWSSVFLDECRGVRQAIDAGMTALNGCRKAGLFREDGLFHQFGDDMADQDMTLLDARRFGRWSAKAVVGGALHLAAASPCQSDCVETQPSGRCESLYDTGGIPTGRDADSHISRTAQGLNLSCEYQVVAIVVSDRRQT